MASPTINRRGGDQRIVEINITNLVDVMMVLLCIVFVSAPLFSQGMDVDLPKTRTVKALPQDKDHLMISLRKDGKIFLEEYEVPLTELEGRLKQLAQQQGKQVFLKADKDVPYGLVIQVMGEMKAAGIDKMNVVAEQDSADAKKKK